MAYIMTRGFTRDEDTDAVLVTSAAGVGGGLTDAELRAAPVPVSVSGVATEATLDARTGSLTETAPASDTASSGLNGRLQRIAQRITSLIALLPASLGQKSMANSLAVTVASDQAAVQTIAAPQTGAVYLGSTALTPKFSAPANIAASQTNASVVALVSGKKLRVLAAVFVAGGTATDLTFRSGTSADISCKFANGANGGASLPFNPCGWFETVSGEALTVTTGVGSTTGISVVYVEV